MAMLIKDNIIFINQKDLKNIIFIFSQNGKLLKTIHLSGVIKDLSERKKWACF